MRKNLSKGGTKMIQDDNVIFEPTDTEEDIGGDFDE